MFGSVPILGMPQRLAKLSAGINTALAVTLMLKAKFENACPSDARMLT